ncbi:hypothetical protein KIH32_01230 [Pseudomonas fluorescens]|uniref:hypothetical protein n=1 Tax=Pseudomonas fluorescens TaxID=294 RepID=UPI001BDA3795|nr:hypothetical protein [Pseudomonas fluorescens]MBT0622512.1 hypothetical protein [Pseudomonas fluorescens]
MTKQFESNLVSVNPFHLAIEKHGEHIYLRVVERATTAQQEAIANGTPVVVIANKVKKIALEMFADANLMSGMRLEQDLGL